MNKAFKWVKENTTVVLGAIAAIVGGILAWGAYNRKVGSLKDNIKIEKTKTKVAKAEALLEDKIKKETNLLDEDVKLAHEIVEAKGQVVKAVDKVEGRSNAEIIDRYNQLYPSSKY